MPKYDSVKDLPNQLQSWEKKDGKVYTGKDLDEVEDKRAAKKEIAAGAEASKFSSKAKAAIHDAIVGAGTLAQRGETTPRSSEMRRLQDVEARGKQAKERLGMKKGGAVKMAKGGSASSRADGCATKGKTKGRMI